jgi:hypothetical protein
MRAPQVLALVAVTLPFGIEASDAPRAQSTFVSPAVQDPAPRSRAIRRGPAQGERARQGPCVERAAQVVDDVYQQVLERPADQASAELTYGLAQGRLTVRDVVAAVAKSPEHGERFFWEPLATNLYRRVMNRDPSRGELRDIIADLKGDRRQLPEVIAGIASRAESNPEDAVRILYRGLLGREADPEGLRAYGEMAQRDGLEAVARAMTSSPEYRRRVASTGMSAQDLDAYETAVRALYRHVLGRDPDPEGLRDLTQVAAVYGFDGVVDRMVASSEYQRLFGSDVVPGSGVRYCGPSR